MPTSPFILSQANVVDFAKDTLYTSRSGAPFGLKCQWGQCDAVLNSWRQLQKVFTCPSSIQPYFLFAHGSLELSKMLRGVSLWHLCDVYIYMDIRVGEKRKQRHLHLLTSLNI